MQTWTLNDIAQLVGAAVLGNANHAIDGLATLKSATETQLSFLANPLYSAALTTTQAGAVLLRPEDAETYQGNALLV
ncbi:MAG: UDP-3-O-(3-hydroxymyristoyl)glucosamine N-acyltransferase, partial [Pseudomonadota bacterium]